MPFSNVALSATLVGGSVTVHGDRNPIALATSAFGSSSGGEAGSLGGIASGTVCGPATWLTFATNVKVEGVGVARFGDKMLHNAGNSLNTFGVANPPVSHSMVVQTPSPQVGVVHVSLVDAVSKQPITERAKVTCGSAPPVTTGNGLAVLTGIPAGVHQIDVDVRCFDRDGGVVNVPAGQGVEVRFELKLARLRDELPKVSWNFADGGDKALIHEVLMEESYLSIYNTLWASNEGGPPGPGAGNLDNATAAVDVAKKPLAQLRTQLKALIHYGDRWVGTKNEIPILRTKPTRMHPFVWPKDSQTPGYNAPPDPNAPPPSPGSPPPPAPKIPWPARLVEEVTRRSSRPKRDRARAVREILHHYIDHALTLPGPPIKEIVVVNEVLNLWFSDKVRGDKFWRFYGTPRNEGEVEWERTAKAARTLWAQRKRKKGKHDWPPGVDAIFRTTLELFKYVGKRSTAQLILNDFDIEGLTPGGSPKGSSKISPSSAFYRYWKPRLFFAFAHRLHAELPPALRKRFIVGFQFHAFVESDGKPKKPMHLPRHVHNLLVNYYRKAGIKVFITEFDVEFPGTNTKTFDAVHRQYCEIYFAVFGLANITSITSWLLYTGKNPKADSTFYEFFDPVDTTYHARVSGGNRTYYVRPGYCGALAGLRAAHTPEQRPKVRAKIKNFTKAT